jgi:hypothetical protein
MKHKIGSYAMVAAALGSLPQAHAAAVVVDWFRLESAGSPAALTLVNDAGLPVAAGALVIASGKGISFPGLPANNVLNGGFWFADTGLADSGAGDARVGAFDIRVAPQNGSASYVLELTVPTGRELILAVGGLFHGAAGSTQSLELTAFSDSGSGAISLLQTIGWDNGSTAYDQEIEWDASSGTLSTTVGSSGDSEMAFLRIGPLAGENGRLVLTVANGYGVGTGDSLTIGLGQVIPEPSFLGLLSLSGVFLLVARRR